nr:alpha-L-arabinofuranosidase C-terminal domain-containing protein [Flavihumibacter fluvii]
MASNYPGYAQTANPILVKAGTAVAPVQSTMWGIFFEDINLGADGGIYAELVKNRSFEFNDPLMGWNISGDGVKEGNFLILNRQSENPNNPRYLRVTATGERKGLMQLSNEGFRGMGIKQGLRYDFSVKYQQLIPGMKLHLELVNEKGEPIGAAAFEPLSGTGWQQGNISFTANATVAKAKFNIRFEGSGQLDLDMISLFPSDTWKGRKGGLRADMVQMLADLKPGFVRFPGGCIVEGRDLNNRYQWKKTIGPIDQRQQIVNRWNTEFSYRPAPDYFQTFGLGFFEYFQMAEDIGAEALPILNCGMACQFNTAELVPMADMDPYVQDALDLIEFANGDATTQWGKLRIEMGHPAPFNLKMMGVGNENWGPQYLERLQLFTKAIKSKYPAFNLIYSAGPFSDGELFTQLDTALRKMGADYIDEHYYRKPDWFLKNAARYDNYDRNGAKIFAGEYAAHITEQKKDPIERSNWLAAMSEAAFMTGLERNAAVVQMASYAPLFAHVDGWQWNPDLIWVDNLRVCGTPSYYVQQLFSTNKGTDVVLATSNGQPLTGQDSLYVSAVVNSKTNELIVKLVNTGPVVMEKDLVIEGIKRNGASVQVFTLKGEKPDLSNSLDQPSVIVPVKSLLHAGGKKIRVNLSPYSLTVLNIPYKK